MIKREELTNPKSCMSRATDQEMTFVLLARDAAAPVAIRAWIAERIRLGKNQASGDAQILEAKHCANFMEQQQRDKIGLATSAPTPPSTTPGKDWMEDCAVEIVQRTATTFLEQGIDITELGLETPVRNIIRKHAPATPAPTPDAATLEPSYSYSTNLAPVYIAEQIFFHVLLRGGKGNPFHGIRNQWFTELAAPKIRELLTARAALSTPQTTSEKEEIPVSWDHVDELLDLWREVWKGDKTTLITTNQQWIVDLAAELFAHDYSDHWGWNNYVPEAIAIINRHFLATPAPTPDAATPKTDLCVKCGFDYGSHSREALTSANDKNWKWPKDACPIGVNPFSDTQIFMPATLCRRRRDDGEQE